MCASHSDFIVGLDKIRTEISMVNNLDPITENEDFIDDGSVKDEEEDEEFEEDEELEEQHRIENIEEDEEVGKEEEYGRDEVDGVEEEDEDIGGIFHKIKNYLQRKTPEDKRNKRKYIAEHSKYQLQSHTPTNPGKHLSPEKRRKRNLKTTLFDKDLKQERGLGCQDPEYGISVDLLNEGSRCSRCNLTGNKVYINMQYERTVE